MQKLGRFQTKPIFCFKTLVFTHYTVEHTPWFHKLRDITKQKVHSKNRKSSENHSDSTHLPQGISVKGPAVSTALILYPDVAPVRDAVHRPHFAHILKHTSDTQCTTLYCR